MSEVKSKSVEDEEKIRVRKRGVCMWFDTKKGFGFISPDDGGNNVFAHHTEIHARGFRCISGGEQVEYEIVYDEKGRIKAGNITGIEGTYVQGPPLQSNNSSPPPTTFQAFPNQISGASGAVGGGGVGVAVAGGPLGVAVGVTGAFDRPNPYMGFTSNHISTSEMESLSNTSSPVIQHHPFPHVHHQPYYQQYQMSPSSPYMDSPHAPLVLYQQSSGHFSPNFSGSYSPVHYSFQGAHSPQSVYSQHPYYSPPPAQHKINGIPQYSIHSTTTTIPFHTSRSSSLSYTSPIHAGHHHSSSSSSSLVPSSSNSSSPSLVPSSSIASISSINSSSGALLTSSSTSSSSLTHQTKITNFEDEEILPSLLFPQLPEKINNLIVRHLLPHFGNLDFCSFDFEHSLKKIAARQSFGKNLSLVSKSWSAYVRQHSSTFFSRITLRNQSSTATNLQYRSLVKFGSHVLILDLASCSNLSESSLLSISDYFPRLNTISIEDSSIISPQMLFCLSTKCPYITSLSLAHCRDINDSFIECFKTLKLKCLDLSFCLNITNTGAEAIAAYFPDLISLSLSGTRVTDTGIVQIVDCCPKLENVLLSKCKHISRISTTALSEKCPNLAQLCLAYCDNLSNNAMEVLKTSQKITHLDISRCHQITEKSIIFLVNELTSLKLLRIDSSISLKSIPTHKLHLVQQPERTENHIENLNQQRK